MFICILFFSLFTNFQGRETKTKSTKKKYAGGKGKGDQMDSESEEEEVKRVNQPGKLEFITVKEVEKQLSNIDSFQDLADIDDLPSAVARHLYP